MQWATRLRTEARLIGAATIQGRLYRVSWYPGVVDSADPGQRVHGEVYALADPVKALAWLDAYEGIVPGTRRPANIGASSARCGLRRPGSSRPGSICSRRM